MPLLMNVTMVSAHGEAEHTTSLQPRRPAYIYPMQQTRSKEYLVDAGCERVQNIQVQFSAESHDCTSYELHLAQRIGSDLTESARCVVRHTL